ncbi:MAG: ABATE domain-containing protein [Candidatus Aminicenantes bacterium]|nr:MAG: ABATE domain-containing protein [Candidatus Aminicenantes bacterium]
MEKEMKKLCLDFANTLQWHASENPQEHLNSYKDLMDWGHKKGILSEIDIQKLNREARRKPDASEKVLKRAIELREAIYRIFSAVAAGAHPEAGDLSILNRDLAKTMAQSRITPTKDGFTWDINGNKEELDWMLKPIVRSAADLLTSNELDRVKECADDKGCGWLFMDRSRNRSRRWCDMKDCGNRAKAKRFYIRKQKK